MSCSNHIPENDKKDACLQSKILCREQRAYPSSAKTMAKRERQDSQKPDVKDTIKLKGNDSSAAREPIVNRIWNTSEIT